VLHRCAGAARAIGTDGWALLFDICTAAADLLTSV
jgi:hypothetical protein